MKPLATLLFQPRSPFTWGPVVGLYGWVEIVAWLLLVVAGISMLTRPRVDADRKTLVLVSAALLVRVAVPWDNYNWYLAVGNAISDPTVFTRATYLPLPNRVIGFWLGGGFRGLVILNIVLGTASVLLFRGALRAAGAGERVALIAAWLLLLTPMYVRLSASDTSQMLVFFVWCATAWAAASGDGWRQQVILFLGPLVACPVRIESAALFPSVWLAAGRFPRQPLRYAGMLAGCALAVVFHAGAAASQLGGVGSILFQTLLTPLRMIGIVDPQPVQYLPVLIAVPIVLHLVRDRARRAATLLPLALLSLPFIATGKVFFTDLSSSSYNILYVPFLFVAAARGLAPIQRPAAAWVAVWAAVAALAVWPFLIVPYRWTYIFQEERRFLDENLPRGPATILAIFEPENDGGDWDCCLALPYPPLLASRPDLKWIVLRDRQQPLDAIDFDYYYRGTLVLLDADTPTPGSLSALLPDDGRSWLIPGRERLHRLQALDRGIRKRFTLESVSHQRLPARATFPLARGTTGVNFGFTSDPEVTIYRRVR